MSQHHDDHRENGEDDGAADPLDLNLLGYADGTLPVQARMAVDRRLETEPGLLARLEAMRAGRAAAETLYAALPAPPAGLSDFLDRALAPTPPRPARPAGWRARLAAYWTQWAGAPPPRPAAGLLAGVLMVGALAASWQIGWQAGEHAGQRAGQPTGPAPAAALGEPDEWREAIAQYLTFYTPETFADLPDDPAREARELAAVGGRLGLDLSAARLGLPDLAFRRAQMFDYEGRPLAQLAFLDPAAGPVLLCVLDAAGAASAPLRTEQRHGLSIAYWTQDGRAFLIAGRLPEARLRALADPLARRLDG